MASGSIGWLFINGAYEAELDLRALVEPGTVSLVGAWLTGEEIPGLTVPFSDFTVRPLGRRYGPEKGTIEHNPDDERIDTHPTSVWLADGIIEARFFNPYSSSEGDWTSGFLIRIGTFDEHHAIFVDDNGGWHHYLRMEGADSILAEGSSEHISTSPSGSNHIRIIALGEEGWLFVNGAPVSTLDLSGLVGSGNVAGVGAYFSSHALAGKFTSFEDFTIWSVGTVTAAAPVGTPTPPPATPTSIPTTSPTATATPTKTPTVSPASTATPIATPAQATPTRIPAASPTPTPRPISIPTATPVATTAPTATATPMPTTTASTSTQTAVGPPPHLKHLEEKELMLTLINAEREKAGVDPVVLGDNIAAQLHADASLENCFFSHWGIDGLKPYMRYSLAGGYQSNGENALGNHYCTTALSTEYRLASATALLQTSSRRFDRPWKPGWVAPATAAISWTDGTRGSTSVSHGTGTISGPIQHFEGDYMEYDRVAETS